MLIQKKIKFIQSLQKKKFRQKYNLFIVEGNKSVKEVINSPYTISEIFSTEEIDFENAIIISEQEFKKISGLTTPQSVLAIVEIPENQPPNYTTNSIVLEDIQDPGNLGTIIRTADWFGIHQIILSKNSVELYNPKVIQASMGSFTRVKVLEDDLFDFTKNFEGEIYAADMQGENIYTLKKKYPFALIMGNEGNGLQENWRQNSHMISIPNYSKDHKAESLNVGVATSIILSEFIGNPS